MENYDKALALAREWLSPHGTSIEERMMARALIHAEAERKEVTERLTHIAKANVYLKEKANQRIACQQRDLAQKNELAALDRCEDLQAEVARLREALEFYANPTEELRDKYGVGMPEFYSETAFADVAIAALTQDKEKEENHG